MRHATWLELFFDLVFVVAVARLGGLLHHDLSVAGFLGFAGLFLLIWWNWLGFSYYADQYDTDDDVHRVMILAVMFVVLVLSTTIDDVFAGGSFAFAAAYLLLRVLYVGMYARAWYDIPGDRYYLGRVLLGSLPGVAFWAASLLVPPPVRYWFWALSFLAGVGGVIWNTQLTADDPVQVSHLPERLGLFTIIVLGEVVFAVSAGAADVDWGIASGLAAIGGFLVAGALWWIHFSHEDEGIIDRMVHGRSRSRERRVALRYTMAHYPVHVGIVAAGVGVAVAIEAAATGHALDAGARSALYGGVGLTLLGSTVCHRSLSEPLADGLFGARLAVVAAVLAVGLLGNGAGLGPAPSALLAGGLLLGLAAFERIASGPRVPR